MFAVLLRVGLFVLISLGNAAHDSAQRRLNRITQHVADIAPVTTPLLSTSVVAAKTGSAEDGHEEEDGLEDEDEDGNKNNKQITVADNVSKKSVTFPPNEIDTLPTFHPKSLGIQLVHTNRLFGWLPLLIGAACYNPKKVLPTALAAAGVDMTLRNFELYHKLVTKLIAFGSSSVPQVLNAQKKPYDTNKSYLITIHPHGVLCDGWFNILPRLTGETFRTIGNGCMDNIKMVLC